MPFSFAHSRNDEPVIAVPAIGLEVRVRLSSKTTGESLAIMETTNAPGFGPPLHTHPETEVFHVLAGRYLYEVDGRRFYAESGDVITVPGGMPHAFVNVTDAPARQFIVIMPGLEVVAFFRGLRDLTKDGKVDVAALNAYGEKWGSRFLGPPLTP